MTALLCPYCSGPAELVGGSVVYPHRDDLAHKRFWRCEPCGAWVGCYPNTGTPLGRLANAELRAAKRAAHDAFDPLWQTRKGSRKKRALSRAAAYAHLAKALGISASGCDISRFDVAMCERVIAICPKLEGELL